MGNLFFLVRFTSYCRVLSVTISCLFSSEPTAYRENYRSSGSVPLFAVENPPDLIVHTLTLIVYTHIQR